MYGVLERTVAPRYTSLSGPSSLLIRLGPLYSELQRLEQASKPQLGQTRGKGGTPLPPNPQSSSEPSSLRSLRGPREASLPGSGKN